MVDLLLPAVRKNIRRFFYRNIKPLKISEQYLPQTFREKIIDSGREYWGGQRMFGK